MRRFSALSTLITLSVLSTACLTLGQNNDPQGDTAPVRWDSWTTQPTDTADDNDVDVPLRYTYVLVVDRTDAAALAGAQAPGVDVDAIELVQGVDFYYASMLHDAQAGPISVDGPAGDFTRLLRAPQEMCTIADPSFVSFGGDGGAAVVSFGNLEELREGDTITVHECGGEQDPDGVDEPYDVYVGVGATIADTRWIPCALHAVGETTCTIPTLPDPNSAPLFFGSCQFVDGACTQFNGSATRADAQARCDDIANPSGQAGTLSDGVCDPSAVIGACASQSPPASNQEVVYFDDRFVNPRDYCETTLGQAWTDLAPITQPDPFRYVMVLDRSETGATSTSGTAGVDLDAIQLVRGMQLASVGQIVFSEQGTGEVAPGASQFESVLGAPEHTCSATAPSFVSLGGEGGRVIVTLEGIDPLQAGDALLVFECRVGAEADEPFDVFVGPSADPTDTRWVPCLTGGMGTETCLVPAVPGSDAAPYGGSCVLPNGTCVEFRDALSRAEAASYCAGGNPSGLSGALSSFGCSADGLAGTCAAASPPAEDDLAVFVYDTFSGSGSSYCQSTLGLRWTSGSAAALPYLYVLIKDKEAANPADPNRTSGVDIDGIGLTKRGLPYYASAVELFEPGGGDVTAANDPTDVLGAPENTCTAISGTFCSLGGAPGALVVSFGSGRAIEAGDVLTVYECGGVQVPGSADERYDVFVGVAADPSDTRWVPCLSDGTSIASCTVPTLPVVGN